MTKTKLTRAEREEVAERIFSVVRRRGTPKAWLARQVGVSRTAILKYERGINLPDRFIEKACEVLEITIDVPKKVGKHNGGGTSERDKPNGDTTPRRGRRTA